jgi:hypothetical protein
MGDVPHEPHSQSKLYTKTRTRVDGDQRFKNLVMTLQRATIEHMATLFDLQQAVRYIVEDYSWYKYRHLQIPIPQKPKPDECDSLLSDGDDDGDDGVA